METRSTRDISVMQLLTQLVRDVDKLVRLADDIDTHATSPQAKAAFHLIGTEVSIIVDMMKQKLDPLYKLYELDPGMKDLLAVRKQQNTTQFRTTDPASDEYDEQALWTDLNKE